MQKLERQEAHCDYGQRDSCPAEFSYRLLPRLPRALCCLEFLRRLRISSLIVAHIDDRYFPTVFYFAFTKFVQKRTPSRVLLQIVGDTFRKKNVTSIAAIHHSLRHIDASAGDIGLLVQIGDFVDGAAMNAHADAKSPDDSSKLC